MSIDTTILRDYFGQAEIYTDSLVPAEGTPQSFVAPSGSDPETGIPTHSSGSGPATYVGLTSGMTTFEYKPDYKGVEVEQSLSEVEPHIVKQSGSVKFKAAVPTVENLALALQSATRTNIAGTGGAPDKSILEVGGEEFTTPISLCLVSTIGQYTDEDDNLHYRYEWVTIFKAISQDGLKYDFKRSENRMLDITLTMFPDLTRAAGKQLFQIGQDKEPA